MSTGLASAITKKEFYTVGEAARCLEVSTDKVRSLCDAGKLDHDRLGPNKNRRIKHSGLVAMMTQLGKPLGDLADPEASANDAGSGETGGNNGDGQ